MEQVVAGGMVQVAGRPAQGPRRVRPANGRDEGAQVPQDGGGIVDELEQVCPVPMGQLSRPGSRFPFFFPLSPLVATFPCPRS